MAENPDNIVPRRVRHRPETGTVIPLNPMLTQGEVVIDVSPKIPQAAYAKGREKQVLLQQVAELKAQGYTDLEISGYFQVSERTVQNWVKENRKARESLNIDVGISPILSSILDSYRMRIKSLHLLMNEPGATRTERIKAHREITHIQTEMLKVMSNMPGYRAALEEYGADSIYRRDVVEVVSMLKEAFLGDISEKSLDEVEEAE